MRKPKIVSQYFHVISLLSVVLACLSTCSLLSGCGGGGGNNGGGGGTQPTVTSVTASCSPTSIQTNQTSTCTQTVNGTGSYSSAVTWTVSPSSIGSISSSGVFTPSAAGTATITATSTQDSTKSGSATVTVTTASTISSVTVACLPASIQANQTSTCAATVTGTGNPSQAITWSVSPTSMGTVSSSGVFTPSGAGTATITATSTQDSTKSGTVTVTVTAQTGMSVSPLSAQVQVFHSQQFSAIISGSVSSAVTWSVNGIVGGNLTLGQIDGTGYYLAPNAVPSPAAVTITATSEADSTQSANTSVTILPDTSTLSITSESPSNGQSGIALDSSVDIQFNESLDSTTAIASNFIISSPSGVISASASYDASSNTVTLVPTALLSPGTQYSVSVSNRVANPAGTQLMASTQWSFTTQTGTEVNGTVPLGTDPTTLTVISYAGQKSTPDSQGNFNASVAPVGTSLIAAMVPGKSFGWLAVAGDMTQKTNASAVQNLKPLLASLRTSASSPVHITPYQITASSSALISSSGIGVDAVTTAEALLFMSPYLHRSDPSSGAIVQVAIAVDPNTSVLAAALQAASTESDPLLDGTVQANFAAAIISVTKTLNASSPLTNSISRANSATALPARSNAKQGHSQADTASQQGVIQTTPPCWSWSTNHITQVASGQLQCLDLDYLDMETSSTPNNGNYTVTLNNQLCPGNIGKLPLGLYSGCDVDWLALTGPINSTVVPADGASAIALQADSSGPGSPLGDFLSCASSDRSVLSGDCNVVMLPGQSSFSGIDPHVGFAIIVNHDLDLSDDNAPPKSFSVPAGTSTIYAMRAYSGGIADSDEYQAMQSGGYGDYSFSLWKSALAINLAHIVIADNVTKLASTDEGPNVDKCAWESMTTSGQIVSLENQFAHQQFDTFFNTVSSLSSDVNSLNGYYKDAVKQCLKDLAVGGLWDMFSKTNPLLDAINTGLEGVSMVGDGGQHLLELGKFASPIETGLVSEVQPTQPVILGVTLGSPNTDGILPVAISGSGFEAGATVSWQTPGGTKQGPDIPLSVGPTTINLNKNFGSQTGQWQVEVANQSGSISAWKNFFVSGQSLLPAPTLSAPTNGATEVSTLPGFSWTSVSGATNYWLMVATSTSAFPTNTTAQSCSGCVISQTSLSGTSYAPTMALSAGTTYYWEVQAYTYSGGTVTREGQYSSPWSFTVSASTAPGTIDPYMPYNGSTPGYPTTTDVVKAAKNYVGAVWGGENCTGLVWAVSDAIGADYYETAQQVANAAQESVSQVRTVVPDPGPPATPPGFPGYVLPNSSTLGINGLWNTFESKTSGGDMGWTSDVQIGDLVRIPTGVLPDGYVHSFIVVGGDQKDGWQVIDNTSPSGAATPVTISLHTFNYPNNNFYSQVLNASLAYISRLNTQSLLAAPTLSTPVSGATGVSTTPNFSWSTVSGATNYWLMVATSTSAFPTNTNAQSCSGCVISQTSLSGTSYTPATALNSNTTYYWEVQAYTWSNNKVTQEGQFSTVGSFTTQSQSLLPAPTLSTPTNGATGVSTTPSFAWSTVTGANGYWVMVATSPSALPTSTSAIRCPSCIITTTVRGTSYQGSTTLASGATYYWQVQAFNDSGTPMVNGQFSSQWPFTTVATSSSLNIQISEGQGFDLEFAPSESEMSAWKQSSPYSDIGVYIGGCNAHAVPNNGPNGCGSNPPSAGTKQTNSNLDATWVSDVSNMGWGIMPLWVGPQASCISGVDPSKVYLIDTSTSTSAYSEGVSEADSAAAVATALGMGSSIVYYDIEAYSNSDTSCDTTTGQFISGWINELRSRGFLAGVYATPQNANQWPTQPDAIWAAYPDGITTASDLDGVLTGSWAQHRIHQYCLGGNSQTCPSPAQQTWGGVTLGTSPNQGLDLDAEDGPVFATQSQSNLPAPTLSAPANGATGVSTAPNFSWSAVSGNAGYRILVAANSSALPTSASSDACGSCVINTTTSTNVTSYTPSAVLSGGTTYYWEVHALTPASNPGYGTWSNISSFATANSNLPAPSLSSPANGATGVSTTPTFSWSAVSGANTYWLMVATSASAFPTSTTATSCPSCVISQGTLTGTGYTPTTALNSNTTYYWEVQAYSRSGSTITQEGQYSSQWSFTVASTAPSISSVSPNPVPGSNSAQKLTINGLNFVSGATLTYYDTSNKSYSGHATNFINSGQLTDPTFDNANDAGTWKVQVVNPGGQTSSTYSFTVN